VLQTKERAPTLSPFDVFIFGLTVESVKELGGASIIASANLGITYNFMVFVTIIGNTFSTKVAQKGKNNTREKM
jgi:hypothetical protein